MEQGPLTFEAYLAQYAPGPGLAVALAVIDPRQLGGHDRVWYLRAEYRQKAHQDMRMHVAVAAVARCDADSEMAGPDKWSAHEVKAALGLTRYHANKFVSDAWDLTERVPALGQAMLAGEMDWPRAEKLLEVTAGQSEEVTSSVVTAMLPKAALTSPKPETTGQISEAAEELAIALNPEYAATKYESGVRQRKVIVRRNPDGTADLTGTQLPPEEAQAASNRVDTLAKARKHAGDSRPIDHLRSAIYCGLLNGTFAGLDDKGILAALAASEPAPRAADEPVTTTGPVRPLDGVELRIRLTTALGIDRKPGDLAGHGPVHADHALQILAGLGAAQWRWVLLNDDGYLLRTGLIPARPKGFAARSGDCSSIVDLHIRESDLMHLARKARTSPMFGGPPHRVDLETWNAWNAWKRFIIDLARRAAEEPAPPGDPNRRFAGPSLRREIQTALSRCIGVGCRVPASRTDLDHTLDSAKGGKTTKENNGPACRYDHTVKHKAGWKLERIHNGYRWISRLRHVYEVLDPPVSRNLPDPVGNGLTWDPLPDPDGDTDSLGTHWEHSGIWEYDGEHEPPPF